MKEESGRLQNQEKQHCVYNYIIYIFNAILKDKALENSNNYQIMQH